ncbi:hypothetical protein OB236_08195 [Paenibacillus sp. WQ 127069]|uniref:DUF4279 domain-containing protein n=1 Tax=Paenibacillus baimaensis TaxID=2982185 RepID=A0ABT2UBU9_9BACL|nr:hypothetical protein [Paenibacillus sp. WQ 127069]MCU6792105.1 hypothetical protein [Paenibacillus sp. WQ 127069]
MWQDIIVNRILTKAELSHGLCCIFGIGSSKLRITPSIEILMDSSDAEVICETRKCNTDFPLILSIYFSGNAPRDTLTMIGEFCEILKCEVIISDDSINPFTMLLVKGKDLLEQITIDLSEFDDNEGFEML